MEFMRRVLVTGGAGYIGAVLVPRLLQGGWGVNVFDRYPFGDSVFASVKNRSELKEIRGDIRDQTLLQDAVEGCEAVIHLALIGAAGEVKDSNLNGISDDEALRRLVRVAKTSGVRRFVLASTSCVYGPGRKEAEITEDLPLTPVMEYEKLKVRCEEVLQEERCPGFVITIFRPAAVCGYSPRMRLDFTVNAMTSNAVNNGVIRLGGGDQMRPHLHIDDMAELYLKSLEWPEEKIDGRVFNVGLENLTLNETAEIVREVVGGHVEIFHFPSVDGFSYHISSEKVRRELGYIPRRPVRQAVEEVALAFREGLIPNSMGDPRYYNQWDLKPLPILK